MNIYIKVFKYIINDTKGLIVIDSLDYKSVMSYINYHDSGSELERIDYLYTYENGSYELDMIIDILNKVSYKRLHSDKFEYYEIKNGMKFKCIISISLMGKEFIEYSY